METWDSKLGAVSSREILDPTTLTVQPDGNSPLKIGLVGTDGDDYIELRKKGGITAQLSSPDPTSYDLEGIVLAGDGDDEIEGSGAYSNDYSEKLYGEVGEDTINGNAGADKLYGGPDSDTLKGGDGDDTIYGGADADFISGGSGVDVIYGEAGNDRLCGADFADLDTNPDDDELYGGAGDDCLDAGYGSSTSQVTQCDGNFDTYRERRESSPPTCEQKDNASLFCDF